MGKCRVIIGNALILVPFKVNYTIMCKEKSRKSMGKIPCYVSLHVTESSSSTNGSPLHLYLRCEVLTVVMM